MVSFEFSKKDFEQLCGKKFTEQQLEDCVLYAKGEFGGLEGDNASIEISDTNRPDLWSIEGIARAIRPFYTKEKGLPKFKTKKSGLVVTIEPSVKKARPYTVCGVAKKVKVSNAFIVQMIQLQEKIANTFGRKRKEAAIGIYDFDKIHGNIRYYGAEPRKTKFVPLEFEKEMDLDEILELHPKGQEFGHLLKGQKFYPIFEDSEGNILSMPPIINSNYSGKITEKTKNLFVEVSGFEFKTISTALNVIMAALKERGAKIETVLVRDGKKTWNTPDFTPKKAELDCDFARKITGLNLSEKQILSLLEKARYEGKIQRKKLLLKYPAYRNDILHQIDIVEDILIAYGYNNIEPLKVKVQTIGSELPETKKAKIVREACIGLGLQEVLTFTLTSKEKQEKKMELEKQDFCEIENYVSLNYQVFRKKILPELLEFLAKNKACLLPHKIFEIGKVVELNAESDTGVKEKQNLCILLSNSEINFNAGKSVLQALEKMLGFKTELQEKDKAYFIPGRSAEILVKEKTIGEIGEVHPKVLENFGIENPVVGIEIEI